MSKFWQIFGLARSYRFQVVMALVYNLLNSVLSLFTFAALAPILRIIFQVTNDEPVAPVEGTGNFFSYNYELLCYNLDVYVKNDDAVVVLAYICVLTVLLALVKNFVYYLGLRNIARIRTAVIRDLRKNIYTHMIQLSLGYFSNERKGDIMSRLTNDLMEVEVSVIGAVESLVKSPIMIIASLVFLFAIDWRLTLFSLIFLPLSGWLISLLAKRLKNAARKGKDALGRLMSIVEETLSGIRIVKAFNAEDEMTERFDEENENYYRLMMKLYNRQYLASPMSEFISIIVIAILLFFGGQLILTTDPSRQFMDGGLFVVYLLVFSQIIPPARALSDAVFKIQKGAASVERINEIVDTPILIKDAPNAIEKETFDQGISVKNIHFSYDDKPIIQGLSFDVPKGQTVALVGPSGGGKSTLANLITRFYDVDEGEILIDGKPIESINLRSYRKQIGYVAQEPVLFNTTVANNLRMGKPDASKQDIVKALSCAISEIAR